MLWNWLPAWAPVVCLAAAGIAFGDGGDTTKAADSSQELSRAETRSEKLDPRMADPASVDPHLPQVLIIGDSISLGYTLPTRKLLEGKANVFRAKANCGPTTRGLENIDAWLGDRAWDLIHFNFGIHDLVMVNADGRALKEGQSDTGLRRTALADYEKNLTTLVQRLRKTGATLIFATTTPLPPGIAHITPGDELKYNEAALRVMKEYEVLIDDLHAWITPHLQTAQRPANVHFLPEGYDKLAEQVAKSIEAGLAEQPGK